jgi:hypothetical protein
MDGQVPRVNMTTGELMPPTRNHDSDLILAWRAVTDARWAASRGEEEEDAHVDVSRLTSKHAYVNTAGHRRICLLQSPLARPVCQVEGSGCREEGCEVLGVGSRNLTCCRVSGRHAGAWTQFKWMLWREAVLGLKRDHTLITLILFAIAAAVGLIRVFNTDNLGQASHRATRGACTPRAGLASQP